MAQVLRLVFIPNRTITIQMGGNIMPNNQDVIEDIYNKIAVMGNIQHIIMRELTKDNHELMIEIMATTLANKGFRDRFTDFAFDEGDDSLKDFVTSINMVTEFGMEEE